MGGETPDIPTLLRVAPGTELSATFTFLAAVALAGASAGAQSHAQGGFTKVEGRVSLAGLDMYNSADIAMLEAGIERTARTICQRGVLRELQDSPMVKDFVASVIENGQKQVAGLTSANQSLASLDWRNSNA